MRGLARLALKLLTGASSVFIAACYGVPYDEDGVEGVVVDARTRVPIPGILVHCLDGEAELARQPTDGQGEFLFLARCTEVRAEDVDGAAGGAYATETVPCDAGHVLVELDALP